MNYFELHVGDYDSATAHLSACEDGIYGRLIRWYMASEQPLPSDAATIMRRVRARTKEERQAVTDMLAEFFVLGPDGYHQARCDEEIARFHDKQAKAKRSAEARWSAHRSQSDGNANAMRTHSEGNAPRARPQTPDTSLNSEGKPSGGSPPAKPPAEQSKTELWRSAVSLLSGQGMPETQARSFIGKLSKDYPGSEIVLEAVRAAVGEQPPDARAYLKATCQRLAGERRSDGGTDWTRTAT